MKAMVYDALVLTLVPINKIATYSKWKWPLHNANNGLALKHETGLIMSVIP